MAKKKITITEGAAVIGDAGEDWMGHGKGSIRTVTIQAARKLSKDPAFNAACWMMYNYGPAMRGETEKDFLDSVKDLVKILRQ
jgi:hypothetical protein